MFEREREPYEYKQDRVAFLRWLNAANDVPDRDRSYALKLLGKALREELTEKQMLYMTAYFVDGKTVREVAEMYGVHATTVSKTMLRARNKIEKVVRYASPALLGESLGGTPEMPLLHRERRLREYNRRRKC